MRLNVKLYNQQRWYRKVIADLKIKNTEIHYDHEYNYYFKTPRYMMSRKIFHTIISKKTSLFDINDICCNYCISRYEFEIKFKQKWLYYHLEIPVKFDAQYSLLTALIKLLCHAFRYEESAILCQCNTYIFIKLMHNWDNKILKLSFNCCICTVL